MMPIRMYSGKGVNDVFGHAVREMFYGVYSPDGSLTSAEFKPQRSNHYILREVEDNTSPDVGKPMLETSALLHIWDPLDRLVYCKNIDVFNLVGLWNYLISGSDSASFIGYYNPIGRRFVDEETSSTRLRANWGERLFASGAVDRCISLLRRSPSTRRAIIPVLESGDVGFESRNLPCLASIQFALRNGHLDAFVTMRSQSAVGVLPYDMFLLTMLQEYVALRAGIPIGEYTHFAPCFGVRQSEIPTMKRVIENYRVAQSSPMIEMEPLAPGFKALYLHCEHKIRTKGEWPDEMYELPSYWIALLRVAYARRFYTDWKDQIKSATDAFPGNFLDNNVDGLAPRPRA